MAAKSMVSYYKEVKSVFNKKMEFQTDLFNRWAEMFGKVYVSKPEEALRRCVFATRCSSILEENEKGLTYRVGLNRFSDLTYDEFVKQNAGGFSSRRTKSAHPSHFSSFFSSSPSAHLKEFRYQFSEYIRPSKEANKVKNGMSLPSCVDWREEGAVTCVKTQSIDDCWVQAVIATIESLNIIMTGHRVNLAAQQLLDCDIRNHYYWRWKGSRSWKRGYMQNLEFAYAYITENGICHEVDYPYTGDLTGKCKQPKNRPVVRIDSYSYVKRSEKELAERVAIQPVTVGLRFCDESFYNYSEGMLFSKPFDPKARYFNHAVELIGYGVWVDEESQAHKCWFAKNSWGPEWGLNGFMRIERDTRSDIGAFGIVLDAIYPTLSSPQAKVGPTSEDCEDENGDV